MLTCTCDDKLESTGMNIQQLPAHARGPDNHNREARLALTHLIHILQLLRDECAALATCLVDPHKLDLRPVFIALRKVEQLGDPQSAAQPVYAREQVLEMTGWSRTTLWRRCKAAGLPPGKGAFTQSEIIMLVK